MIQEIASAMMNKLWFIRDISLGYTKEEVEEHIPNIASGLWGEVEIKNSNNSIEFICQNGFVNLAIHFNAKSIGQYCLMSLKGDLKDLELYIDDYVRYVSSPLPFKKLNKTSRKFCEKLAEPDYDMWYRELPPPLTSQNIELGVNPNQFLAATFCAYVIIAMVDETLSPAKLSDIQSFARAITGAKLSPQELNALIQEQVDFVEQHGTLDSIAYIKYRILPEGHKVHRVEAENVLGACLTIATADGNCSHEALQMIVTIAINVFGYDKFGRNLNFLVSDGERRGKNMSSARKFFEQGA